MKRISRIISVLLIFSLIFQTAFAEDQFVASYKSYEAENGFSLKSDAIVKNHSAGKIGELRIQGDGLTILEQTSSSVPIFIVSNGKSVQFSLVNIKDFINLRST